MADAIPLSDARDILGDLVNRAAYAGERVVIERRGKPAAVLVPVSDLEALEAFEDAADVRAYDEAKAEWEADGRKTVSLDELKAELAAE